MKNVKRQKTDCQPNRVSSAATRQRFHFGELPTEIQEYIIIKAAVSLRLSSESFGDVYDGLAPVCWGWSKMAKDKCITEQIKKQAVLQDPMCRYLHKAQPLRTVGFENHDRYIICAVTLGNALYVTEFSLEHPFAIFMYNIDDSDVRHKNPTQRKIMFSNRRPLVVTALTGYVIFLASCPHNDCLYVFEYTPLINDFVTIHKIKPDGTVLLSWSPIIPTKGLDNFSLSKTGAYLTIFSEGLMYMYCTTTGVPVDTVTAAAERDRNVEVSVQFSVKLTTAHSANLPSFTFDYRRVHAFDDQGCELRMSQSHITLCNLRSKRQRELRKESTRRYSASYYWFDKPRGLIICTNVTAVRVFRVMH